MINLIPTFEWHRVVVQPWTADFSITVWIVLMGFFVTAACGLVGNFLLLRRMALVGDAISHSILPGLVVAFMIFKTATTWVAFTGSFGRRNVDRSDHRVHSPAVPRQARRRDLHCFHDALCRRSRAHEHARKHGKLSYRRRLRAVWRNRFRAAGTAGGLERIRAWSALGVAHGSRSRRRWFWRSRYSTRNCS